MKQAKLLVVGFWSSLLALSAVADDGGSTAFENSAVAASGNQTQEGAGTKHDSADGGAPKAATTKGKGKAAPTRMGTGSGHLLRYIYDQDKKGDMKIEGMTDTAPPP